MLATTRLALAVRILIALFTRTIFQPDEYFQSLEPAYHLVFGYGHLTWEWLAPRPIRSILYPALNVPIYWVLKSLKLEGAGVLGDWLLIACPRILHGALAAATDVWTCEIALRVLGRSYVPTTYFLSLTSFFHALSLSRSLSNSLETSLTTIAFAYYPWDASPRLSPQLIYHKSRIRKTIIFSALACMVRPTNGIIWVFLFANLFWAVRSRKKVALAILSELVTVAAIALFSLFVVDSLYYNKPTCTPLNFLLTNLSAVSLFYGINTWHYYLTQALPILCTTALPFALHGMWSSLSIRDTTLRTMLATTLWSIGVYSLAGHKEWRFIHPLLPLLYVFAAKSLVDLAPSEPRAKKQDHKRLSTRHTQLHTLRSYLPLIRNSHLTLLLLTIPPSLYVVLFYCSAPISVLSYIRTLPRVELRDGGLGFLMPCHSTPGQAYLHREELSGTRMWALGCEPPLHPTTNQDLATYRDQTDVFFNAPVAYFHDRFPHKVDPSFPVSPFPASIPGVLENTLLGHLWKHEWPRYLVLFGALLQEEGVKVLLEEKGYKEVWKRGRGWEGEGQRKGGVRVWKWFP